MNETVGDTIDPGRHYGAHYLSRERWMSYVYQVTALADVQPSLVAEIGVGPGVVRDMVSATYPTCRYVSIDVAPALDPDVSASVAALPFVDRAFDAVFCCQVLEHLPYTSFVPALKELGRVTKRRLVLSLPDVSPFFYLRVKGARRFLGPLWRGISLPHPFPRLHDFASDGQHYWEIGTRGYPIGRILSDIGNAGLRLEDQFRMIERSYWHFFLLHPEQ